MQPTATALLEQPPRHRRLVLCRHEQEAVRRLIGRCRLDLHFRLVVGLGGRLRRLGGDRGLDGGSDRLGGLAPLAPLRIPRHARLPAHRAELCTVPEGGGGGKA